MNETIERKKFLALFSILSVSLILWLGAGIDYTKDLDRHRTAEENRVSKNALRELQKMFLTFVQGDSKEYSQLRQEENAQRGNEIGLSSSFIDSKSKLQDFKVNGASSTEFDLHKLAEQLTSRWKNTAEKTGCHHLASKTAREDAGVAKVLPKTATSRKLRFVFIVGLEGMGLHFLGPMFKSAKTTECLPKPEKVDNLASTLAHSNMREGLFGSESGKEQVKERLRKYMKMLLLVAKKHKYAENRHSVIINTMCMMKVGELSYPNDFMTNNCHKTDFVDVRVLGDIFEALKLDFRVMFMYRNALDVLLSTSVHRRMGEWIELEGIYEHIMKKYVIKQQLNRLSSDYYMCFDYDKLPNLPKGFGDFFNLDPDGKTKFRVTTFHHPVAGQLRETERSQYAEKDFGKVYQNLQTALDELWDLCQANRSIY
eukprot:snap_masked-scaffold_3-processed-gene-0.25-mRNA-1 protein AED:1.00 eAED:1.00 QI:0/-1/0/0/-1/1/1/0/426